MIAKKYLRAIEDDEKFKAEADARNDLKTFRIKKINRNPVPNKIVSPEMPASYNQKMYLSEIMDHLESFGLKVLIPKKTENLKKGEIFDLIRKLLEKQREVEVAMIK
jgi:hypothetical protein